MEEDISPKISKYNSGVAQIYRLDNLWKNTHSYAFKGDYSMWNLALDRLWLELASDLNNGDLKEFKAEYEAIELKLKLSGSFFDVAPSGFKSIPKDLQIKKAIQYKLLMDKQLLMKRIENSTGKGTAYQDDIETYLD